MSAELMLEIGWKSVAVLVLVMLNGFFVAAEFALVKIRATQLTPLIAEGNRRARMARHLVDHLDAYLSAAQLGITLASLGLGWIGEPIFAKLLAPLFDAIGLAPDTHGGLRHSLSFGIGFSVITFLHIVVGEMAPKSLAIRKSLGTALWVAYPFHWFYVAMKPFILALNHSALWLLRLVGVEAAHEHEGAHSEEELRLLIEASQPHTTGRNLGREIVLNALDLRERIARDVMRPRGEIQALDTTAPIKACLDLALRNRYSRYPLCVDGDLDRMIGVVHIKDLFARRMTAKTGAHLAGVARKLIYIPATARLEKLLELFMERRVHLAVVVDEYGGTSGLVTLENVLEELVGQIQDEFDHEERPLLKQLSETEWELDGDLPVHELEDLIGVELEDEDVATTSGLVTQRLGGFPREGDALSLGEYQLTVLRLAGTTVDRLRLQRVSG